MTATHRMLSVAALIGLLLAPGRTEAQVRQASYSQPNYTTGQTERMTPAMRYFSAGRTVPTPQQTSRRPAVAPQQVQAPGGKPFQDVDRNPNLSPYLSLDMVQTNEGIPNYHLRVLPQQQLQEATHKQKVELRRLRRELRIANAPGLNFGSRGVTAPTTGGNTQFMNRGQYFPAVRR